MNFFPGRSWRWPLLAAFLVGGTLPAAAPAAADETRILGQVTQGEVDDVTRGALMDAPPAYALPAPSTVPIAPMTDSAGLDDQDAALRGDAAAMYRLAGRYETGDGIERNTAIALSWYGRAADSGIAEAVPKVIALREQLNREDDFSRAVASELAGTNSPAPAVRAPRAVERPVARATPPETPARPAPTPAPVVTAPTAPVVTGPPPAAKPPATPAINVAESLRLAAAAPNDADALRYYRAAAEQGSADGAFNLAYRLANGKGTAQNDTEAARWYRAAGEQGNAAAQNNLGFMYASGRGVARDDATAVEWYRKAAAQNYAPAQTNLGMMYDAGRGVAASPADALAWYSKAAAAGYGPARTRLADMYATGRGVPRDERMAEFWRQSASTGAREP